MTLILALALSMPSSTLAAQAKVGDQGGVTMESTLDLDIEIEDGSGKSTRLLSLVRKEAFRQQVVDVTAGKASRVAVLCTESSLRRSGTGLPLAEARPTGLQGARFYAVRTANGWMARGEGVPEGAGYLGAWNDLGVLLPPGSEKEWSIDAAKLAGLLAPAAIETGEGTLKCEGGAAANNRIRVTFSGSVQGVSEDGSAVKLTVTVGRAVFDAATRKPLSLDITGSVESVREIIDRFMKRNENVEEARKVGEIRVTSRKLQVSFTYND